MSQLIPEPTRTYDTIHVETGFPIVGGRVGPMPVPGVRQQRESRASFAPTTEQIEARELLKSKGHNPEPLGHAQLILDNPSQEDKINRLESTAEEGGIETDPETYESGKGKAVHIDTVAKALNANAQFRIGNNPPMDDASKQAHALNELTDFASHQLTKGDDSGINWYDKNLRDFENGFRQLVAVDPAFKSLRGKLTPERMALLKVVLAAHSPNNGPINNTLFTVEHLRNIVQANQRNPFSALDAMGDDVKKINYTAHPSQFEMLADLVRSKGEKGAVRWLLSTHSWKELKSVKEGMKSADLPSDPFNTQDKNLGVYILGPKAGAFAANLNGHHEHLTKDRWWARTWARMFGTLIDSKGQIISGMPNNPQDRRLQNQTAVITAKSLGLTTDEFQAVVWYAEQALWQSHGHGGESESFSDGINAALNKAGLSVLPPTQPNRSKTNTRKANAISAAIARRNERGSSPFKRFGELIRFAQQQSESIYHIADYKNPANSANKALSMLDRRGSPLPYKLHAWESRVNHDANIPKQGTSLEFGRNLYGQHGQIEQAGTGTVYAQSKMPPRYDRSLKRILYHGSESDPAYQTLSQEIAKANEERANQSLMSEYGHTEPLSPIEFGLHSMHDETHDPYEHLAVTSIINRDGSVHLKRIGKLIKLTKITIGGQQVHMQDLPQQVQSTIQNAQTTNASPAGGNVVSPTASVGKSEQHEDLGQPNAHLQKLATEISGRPLRPISSVTRLDPARHMKIADAYAGMKHDPSAVASNYNAMKQDIAKQFRAAQQAGYLFHFSEDDPYSDAHSMMEDVKKNKRLGVFSGGSLPKDHPLTEIEPTSGRSYNELFRAVHDLFGHSYGGHTFSPVGEENAFRTHAALFSPEALPALANETVGQNSLMHFGPHMRTNGQMTSPDDPKYIARKDRPYSEQKAGLLPDETLAELRKVVGHGPTQYHSEGPTAGRPLTRGQKLANALRDWRTNRLPEAYPVEEPQGNWIERNFGGDTPGTFGHWLLNTPMMRGFNWLGSKVEKLQRSGVAVKFAADQKTLTSLYGPEFAKFVGQLKPHGRLVMGVPDWRWYKQIHPSVYGDMVDPLLSSRVSDEVFHHLVNNPNFGQIGQSRDYLWTHPYESAQEAYDDLNQAWRKSQQTTKVEPSQVHKQATWEPPISKLSRGGLLARFAANTTFASPNQEEGLDFNAALRRLRSPDQKAFRQLAQHIYSKLGLSGDVHDAIGDWSDGAENSLVHVLNTPSDDKTMEYAGAWLGLLANQKSVLSFKEGQGPDSLYEIDLPYINLGAIRDQLTQQGIQYRTLIPDKESTKVLIYDQNRQLAPKVANFAKVNNATVRESTGQGRFIGDSTDSPTRTAARSKYRGIIDSYEGGNAGQSTTASESVPTSQQGQTPIASGPSRLKRRGILLKFASDLLNAFRKQIASDTPPNRIEPFYESSAEASKAVKARNEAEQRVANTKLVKADWHEERGEQPEAEFERWSAEHKLHPQQFPEELGTEAWRPGTYQQDPKLASHGRFIPGRTNIDIGLRTLQQFRPLIIRVKDPNGFRGALVQHQLGGRSHFPLAPLSKEQFPNAPVTGRPIHWIDTEGNVLAVGNIGGGIHDENAVPQDLGSHWQVYANADQNRIEPIEHRDAYFHGYQQQELPINTQSMWDRLFHALGVEDSENHRPYGHSAPGAVLGTAERQLGLLHPSRQRLTAHRAYEQESPERLVTRLLAQKGMSHLSVAQAENNTGNTHRPLPADAPDELVTTYPVEESIVEEARRRYNDLLKLRHHANASDFKSIVKHVVNEYFPKPITNPHEALAHLRDIGAPFADQIRDNFPHWDSIQSFITPENVGKISQEIPAWMHDLPATGKHSDILGQIREQGRSGGQNYSGAWARSFRNWSYQQGLSDAAGYGPDLWAGGRGPIAVLDRIRELKSHNKPLRFIVGPNPLKRKLARMQAPAGGMVIRGLYYQGGKWLPVGFMKQAPQQKRVNKPQFVAPAPNASKASLLNF